MVGMGTDDDAPERAVDLIDPPEPDPSGAVSTESQSAELRPAELALGPRSQHLLSAFVATIAGVLLVAGAESGPHLFIAAIAVVQAVLIWSWIAATRIPGWIGTVVLAVAAAAGSDAAVLAWPHSQLDALIGVVAFIQIGAFVHQLARGVARKDIVTSLGLTEVLLIAVVGIAALMQLRQESDGRDLTVAVVAAIAAALVEGHLVDLAWTGPRFDPEVRRGLLAAAISVVVSAGVSYAWLDHQMVLDHRESLILGAALGVLTGLFAVAVAFALHQLPAIGRAARPFVSALLPLALLAPVAFVLVAAVQG
jgi:2C-methyl-D-erythritol 2,4-cyclodiphosphate synthase